MNMSNAKEEKSTNVDGFHFSHESEPSQPASPVRNYKDTVFRMLFSDKEELIIRIRMSLRLLPWRAPFI